MTARMKPGNTATRPAYDASDPDLFPLLYTPAEWEEIQNIRNDLLELRDACTSPRDKTYWDRDIARLDKNVEDCRPLRFIDSQVLVWTRSRGVYLTRRYPLP
ncbi:hypothetical protein ACT3SZ_15540 [Corynebacterium sp. AOP40-9SA-29]|uniref:hypothetical protein n=1 Tax=Corynebacterium sp. AOP40-9SA-29 TaxID=3457677 RepID=UPI0040334F57